MYTPRFIVRGALVVYHDSAYKTVSFFVHGNNFYPALTTRPIRFNRMSRELGQIRSGRVRRSIFNDVFFYHFFFLLRQPTEHQRSLTKSSSVRVFNAKQTRVDSIGLYRRFPTYLTKRTTRGTFDHFNISDVIFAHKQRSNFIR